MLCRTSLFRIIFSMATSAVDCSGMNRLHHYKFATNKDNLQFVEAKERIDSCRH